MALSTGSVVVLDILCTKLTFGSDVAIFMKRLLKISSSVSSDSNLDIDLTNFLVWTCFQLMAVMRGTGSPRSNLPNRRPETSLQGNVPRIHPYLPKFSTSQCINIRHRILICHRSWISRTLPQFFSRYLRVYSRLFVFYITRKNHIRILNWL